MPDRTKSKQKRSKTAHAHEEVDSDNEAIADNVEHFVIQAGHKFCILYAPWLHSGKQLFQLDLDDSYTPAERAENMEMKSQAQLKEVWELLRVRFELKDLKQAWVARAVCPSSIFFRIL